MLLCTKSHFVKSVKGTLAGEEGSGTPEERKESAAGLTQRIRDYATDESGLRPGPKVWTWTGSNLAKLDHDVEEAGSFESLVNGNSPRPGQRIVYVDGGFDLFSSGHIEFLRKVLSHEEEEGVKRGWNDPEQKEKRLKDFGEDYSPAYIVAGIHDDDVINKWKGLNYPIMNIFERGLCVLQCRVSHPNSYITLSPNEVLASTSMPSSFRLPLHQPNPIWRIYLWGCRMLFTTVQRRLSH